MYSTRLKFDTPAHSRVCYYQVYEMKCKCSLYARHFFSQLHELITRTTHTHWPFVSCFCFTLSSNQHRTFDAALCVQLKNKWWSHHQTTPFPPYFEVEQCRLTSIYFLCISQNLWFLTDQSLISTVLMFILCGPRALLLLFSRFVSHLENKKKTLERKSVQRLKWNCSWDVLSGLICVKYAQKCL